MTLNISGRSSHSVVTGRCIAVILTATAAVLAGCQSSRISTRKSERMVAYQALTASEQTLVDRGELQTGMNTNAVYIALGDPTEVIQVGLPDGSQAVWTYYRPYTRTQTRWVRRMERYGEFGTYDYRPVMYSGTYPAITVVFKGGKVIRWQSLPAPSN